MTRSQPRFEAADVHLSPSATNPYNYASGGVLRGAITPYQVVTS